MEEMMKDTQAAQSAAQPTAGAQAEKKPRFSLPKGKKGKKVKGERDSFVNSLKLFLVLSRIMLNFARKNNNIKSY